MAHFTPSLVFIVLTNMLSMELQHHVVEVFFNFGLFDSDITSSHIIKRLDPLFVRMPFLPDLSHIVAQPNTLMVVEEL